jgi:hypothetical protein
VTVYDTFPAGYVFDQLDLRCTGVVNVVCNVGTLSVGDSASMLLGYHVTASSGFITNCASVGSASLDPNPLNYLGCDTNIVSDAIGTE